MSDVLPLSQAAVPELDFVDLDQPLLRLEKTLPAINVPGVGLFGVVPLLRPRITDRGVTGFVLENDYAVAIDTDRMLLIPRCSVSNFASIPWYLRWVLSPTDPVYVVPSIAHDHLVQEWSPTFGEGINDEDDLFSMIGEYQAKPLIYNTKTKEVFTREQANLSWVDNAEIFRTLVKQNKRNSASFKSGLGYAFLRVAGFIRNYK